MTVYHGSAGEDKKPNVLFSKNYLDFVCECWKGSEIYKDYDIIIGTVADDDVFKSVLRIKRHWKKS